MQGPNRKTLKLARMNQTLEASFYQPWHNGAMTYLMIQITSD